MVETVFVGREHELKRLHAFLDQVLAGHGQVVFVAGEAGSGKTALLHAFTQQAEKAHSDLLVVMGNCNAQGGISDPYLPFREVLTAIAGGTEDHPPQPAGGRSTKHLKDLLMRSTQVLVEFGPDLIGTIVPGTLLVAKFGRAIAQKAGLLDELERLVKHKGAASGARGAGPAAIDQTRIFEQYANVLVALARQQPLVIILDDLQWADDSSVSLLFHLSRRIEHSRILIIGTYRPDEVAALRGDERHPLEKVLGEIKRYAGDVWVDLDETTADVVRGRTFVDQLVDSEPNSLDEAFRRALYEHTNGHALFTVELLRALQERGDLVRDTQGCWAVVRPLVWSAGTVPARVEGAIAARLAALEEAARDVLRTASVQGVDFVAEVVAQAQRMPVRELIKQLSMDLEQRHRLVRERGELKGAGQRLSGYQFTNALFQQFLYDELGGAARRLLHGDVARAIEQFYADQLDDLSAQLAWHYVQAGEDDRAIDYLIRAGERALRQGAPLEARGFFGQALDLLPVADGERRWRALLGRADAFAALDETSMRRQDIAALLALAEAFDDDARRAAAYQRQAKLALNVSDYPLTLQAADQAIAAARRAHQPELEMLALAAQVFALTWTAQGEGAHRAFEELLSRADAFGDSPVSAFVLNEAAYYYVNSGDPVRAMQLHTRAGEMAHRLGDRSVEGLALANVGFAYGIVGLFDQARRTLESSMQILKSAGDLTHLRTATRAYYLILAVTGDMVTAQTGLEQALAEFTAAGDQFERAFCLATLAFIDSQKNDWDSALQRFLQSRDIFAAIKFPAGVVQAEAQLALCSLRLGRLGEAKMYAEKVWSYLQAPGAFDAHVFGNKYLICAGVFEAAGEIDKAHAAIEAGYREMMAFADKLTDPEWCTSYLEHLPDNVALAARWRAMHPDAPTGSVVL